MDITTDTTLTNSDPGRDPLVGTVLDGTYKIESKIGSGGMGSVYRAHHQSMDRTVAIKVLETRTDMGPQQVQRFRQEARSLNLLSHPNIVSCYAFGFDQGRCFLTMDYVDGKTLSQSVTESGPLSAERFQSIFTQTLSALAHAHDNGLLHRDLKPENIMLIEDGGIADRVKLVDFGIAKLLDAPNTQQQLTATGAFMGSPYYMSPEQCKGQALDARSDIYSLGCVMYFALSGHPPFTGESLVEILQQHLQMPPPALPGSVPSAISDLVMTALEKDPALRFASATEMLEACQSKDYHRPKRRSINPSFKLIPSVFKKGMLVGLGCIAAVGLGKVVLDQTGANKLDQLQLKSAAVDYKLSKVLEATHQDNSHINNGFSQVDKKIFTLVDQLLQTRINYINALLDKSDLETATSLTNGISEDMQKQHAKTSSWPILSSSTLSSLEKLGFRFLQLKQNHCASIALLSAINSRAVRALHPNYENTDKIDSLEEARLLTQTAEKAQLFDLDASCTTLSGIHKDLALSNRPRAYTFAAEIATGLGDQQQAKQWARRAYETSGDTINELDCAFTKNTQAEQLLKVAAVLMFTGQLKESKQLCLEAIKLSSAGNPDCTPIAPYAAYNAALAGKALPNADPVELMKYTTMCEKSCATRDVNSYPAHIMSSSIARSQGKYAESRRYLNLALAAERRELPLPDQFPREVIRELRQEEIICLLNEQKFGPARLATERLVKEMAASPNQAARLSKTLELAREFLGHAQYKQALDLYQQAVAIVASTRDFKGVAVISNEIVAQQTLRNDLQGARQTLSNAIAVTPSTYPLLLARLYRQHAAIEFIENNWDASRKDSAQAIALLGNAPPSEYFPDLASSLLYCGVSEARMGSPSLAETSLRRCLTYCDKMQSSAPLNDVLLKLQSDARRELRLVLKDQGKSQ